MNRSNLARYGVSCLPLIALVCSPARAQSGTAGASSSQPSAVPHARVASSDQSDSSQIGEIIVTAQRRSESLQKTALTIQVIEPKALSAAGVTSPSQLAVVLPAVQISYSGPATSVYIRGVGGFQSTAGTSPAVPYYIDGVYVARTQSVASEFYDVDRVEAVKGPQGTLYGRNASGGAINVITKRPSFDRVEGRAEFELGNYGNQTFEASLNVPLSSTVAVRTSGTFVDKQGFTSLRFGEDVHQSARLKLLWEPSSDLSLQVNGSYGHIGGSGAAIVATNKEIAGWYPWIDISDPRSRAFGIRNAVAPPPFVQPSTGANPRQDLKFYNISAQLDWKVGEVSLVLIPAYRRSQMQYRPFLGFTYSNGLGLGSLPARPETSDATSLELRASGEAGPLNWLVGGFFYDEDQFQQYTIDGGFLQRPGVLANYGTRSLAAFSQNTVKFTDSVRLILGARYTSDRRSLTDGQTFLVSPAAFQGPPPANAAACAFPTPTQAQCLVDSYAGRKTFGNFSWKVGFEADVMDNSLFYATASRGFKAGGFNTQSIAGQAGQAPLFEPEKLTSYEAGFKSRFLNNRLQLNMSGYYWDYKNHQEPVLTYTNVPGVTNLIYQNAGAAEIYGGTLDLIARPWRGATINGSVEYAHSKYTSYSVAIPSFSYSPEANGCRVSAANAVTTTLDCSGFEVARTPKWSGIAGITQDVTLDDGTLSANAAVSFASSRWLSVDFVAAGRAPAYGKLDLSISYRAPGDRWSVTGFVRNVTDTAVYGDGSRNPFSPLFYASIQPPRTWGGRVAVRF